MLLGKPTVFLSCSEKHKATVAMPIREKLWDEYRIYGVIVSEEPLLPGVSGEPNKKVDSYLKASDALVALCTPDNHLDDGTIECRQNIIDEIQRAYGLGHLENRIQIFKAPNVKLPSNINPTYERLEIDNPLAAVPKIFEQLSTWGVLDKTSFEPTPFPTEKPIDVESYLSGLGLGNHEKARERAYQLMRILPKEEQYRVVAALGLYMLECSAKDEDYQTEILIAASFLEAMDLFDPNLVGYSLIEKFTLSDDFSVRSCAAMLLYEKVKNSPSTVPIDQLGRLARTDEDWYVYTPAFAAVKNLILVRDDAYVILERLAISDEVEDRVAAAGALFEIAERRPGAVNRKLAERLSMDAEQVVSGQAIRVLQMIGESTDDKTYADRFFPF